MATSSFFAALPPRCARFTQDAWVPRVATAGCFGVWWNRKVQLYVGPVESYSPPNDSYSPRISSLARGCGSSCELHICLHSCYTCVLRGEVFPARLAATCHPSTSKPPSLYPRRTTGHILPPSTTVSVTLPHPCSLVALLLSTLSGRRLPLSIRLSLISEFWNHNQSYMFLPAILIMRGSSLSVYFALLIQIMYHPWWRLASPNAFGRFDVFPLGRINFPRALIRFMINSFAINFVFILGHVCPVGSERARGMLKLRTWNRRNTGLFLPSLRCMNFTEYAQKWIYYFVISFHILHKTLCLIFIFNYNVLNYLLSIVITWLCRKHQINRRKRLSM